MKGSSLMGTEPIGKLLAQQAIPAAIGFMVMSVNMVVDRFYVGQYIHEMAIGAVSVVMPIAFLISSFGMSIGMGGASIVSRALGANEDEKVQVAFNNQISLTLILMTVMGFTGYFFREPILDLWGAKGQIMDYALPYLTISLLGIPFLGLGMMANNNLRAEGKANMAMMVLFVPSVFNIIFDHILIKEMDMGIEGAAWATSISYIATGLAIIYFYGSGRGELKVDFKLFKLQWPVVKEIFSVGSVSLIRQGSISILMMLLNAMLFEYGNESGIGGERAISIYGIASGISMFAFFPLIGIAQGFVPIAGFNYGAKKYDRVKEVIYKSLLWGGLIAALLCAMLLLGASVIPKIFTKDPVSLEHAPDAIFYIFLATPVVVFQLIGASYFQALGKGLPALLLTLSKQAFFLIPLVLIIPLFYGLDGIWYSFAISDILSAIVCSFFLWKGVQKYLKT